MNRRNFLKVSGIVSGALLLDVDLGIAQEGPTPVRDMFTPNAWLQIHRDNTIIFFIDKSELGQGIVTGLTQLLAEELHIEPALITCKFAPADPVYRNTLKRVQVTGDSTGIRSSWHNIRHIGAITRELFIDAAAHRWQTPREECCAENGAVIHRPSQRRFLYGELINIAATQTPRDNVVLTSTKQFHVIGKSVARLDIDEKLNGHAKYGIDIELPDLVIATTLHAPWINASLDTVDARHAKTLDGVIDVFPLDNIVVVVATTYYQADNAMKAVVAKWKKPLQPMNSDDIFMHWTTIIETPGKVAHEHGDAISLIHDDEKSLQAHYRLPYQAHATAEPMNCTVNLSQNQCDIWVPTQSQSVVHETAAQITGLDYTNIHVHTTYSGGGFGRRGEIDFVQEALRIAQHVKRPVKLIWNRERDMQNDYYRPANVQVIKATIDDKGLPLAIWHRIVCPPILGRIVSDFGGAGLPRWMPFGLKRYASHFGGDMMLRKADPTATVGASPLPYRLPHHRLEHTADDPGIPVGFWRSVGHSQNAFVIESFIDELAHKSRIDPYQYRRQLLAEQPAVLRVLDAVANLSHWTSPQEKGKARGMAIHQCFGSTIGQVAEVMLSEKGDVIVTHVYCVIDCGTAVNPELVKTQIEGGIVFGLTATLKSEITIDDGKIQQSNYHDFPLLRFSEMPDISIDILPSDDPPGGVGETGVPCIAPAVANALFSLTGKRVRKLPIRRRDLIDA